VNVRVMMINPKIEKIRIEDIMAIDTEYNSPIPLEAQVLAIALSNSNETYVLECRRYAHADIVGLLKQLQDCKQLIAHNAKADALVIRSNYNVRMDNWCCTMLASQVIDNGNILSVKGGYRTNKMVGNIPVMEKPHSLAGCLQRYLGIELSKEQQASFLRHPFSKLLSEEQLIYAGGDTHYLLSLYAEQRKYLISRELTNITDYVEYPLISVLTDMELIGCKVDAEAHLANIAKWNLELKDMERRLDELAGIVRTEVGVRVGRRTDWLYEVDLWNRTTKVFKNRKPEYKDWGSRLLMLHQFEVRGEPLPVDQENAQKTSVSQNNLEYYLINNPGSPLEPVITLFIERVKLKKKISTYGRSIINALDADGRMRTSYGQCFAETGRLTSSAVCTTKRGRWHRNSGLNLANIPKDNALRNLFITDDNYSFVDSDFEGQEVFIATDYSQEPLLINALENGFDHHSFLASDSFSIIFGRKVTIENEDKVLIIDGQSYNMKKELRQEHKNCLFSLFYGGGPKRVFEYLGKFIMKHNPPEQGLEIASKVSKKMKTNLPVLVKYLDKQVGIVKKQGFLVSSKLGRRRYFYDTDSAFGDAMNYGIQGSGGESMKFALIKIDKWIRKRANELGYSDYKQFGWITFTVYDQVVVSLHDDHLDEAEMIPTLMKESLDFFLTTLPAGSDLNITKKWQK